MTRPAPLQLPANLLVAGNYWLAHHRDFDQVVHYDRGLWGYNLLFLLFIGLFPFSTTTISLTSLKSSAYPFYWAVYAANTILAGIMLNLTWNYAVSHRLVTPETIRQQSQHTTVRQTVTPAVFLISIVADCLFPHVFLGPYALLVIPLAMWGAGTSPSGRCRRSSLNPNPTSWAVTPKRTRSDSWSHWTARLLCVSAIACAL